MSAARSGDLRYMLHGLMPDSRVDALGASDRLGDLDDWILAGLRKAGAINDEPVSQGSGFRQCDVRGWFKAWTARSPTASATPSEVSSSANASGSMRSSRHDERLRERRRPEPELAGFRGWRVVRRRDVFDDGFSVLRRHPDVLAVQTPVVVDTHAQA